MSVAVVHWKFIFVFKWADVLPWCERQRERAHIAVLYWRTERCNEGNNRILVIGHHERGKNEWAKKSKRTNATRNLWKLKKKNVWSQIKQWSAIGQMCTQLEKLKFSGARIGQTKRFSRVLISVNNCCAIWINTNNMARALQKSSMINYMILLLTNLKTVFFFVFEHLLTSIQLMCK